MAEYTNAQIAAAFDELADLYELDGAIQYRVIAYRTAAKAVRDASVAVMGLAPPALASPIVSAGLDGSAIWSPCTPQAMCFC